MLVAPEGEHDECHLRPLEEHTLEGEREPVPVRDGAPPVRGGPLRCRQLPLEDRLLVVQGGHAARAQHRFAQPLHAEHQQERADDEAQGIRRDRGECGPERGHHDREDGDRRHGTVSG